jgi:predicted nucleotidyltransferase
MSVLGYLNARASAAVLSDTENLSITTSISTIQGRLDSYFPGKISSRFQFGSSTRGTILPRKIDEHSDIDLMVVFKESGFTPQTYLDRLRTFVDYYYPRSSVKQSSPTIVLELNHIKFDLVPALNDWLIGFKIPDTVNGWRSTNPNDFSSTLTAKNNACGYLIKPTIRLAKMWNANSGYVFDSYSFEKWIVEQSYLFCSNQKDYLFTVFDNLVVPHDTQWRRDKVERAKAIVAEVRSLEVRGMPIFAELEIKRLIPE